MGAHPGCQISFVEGARGKLKHGPGCVCFFSHEAGPIHFKEENAGDKAGSLVAIHKRMIADDARDVGGRQVNQVRSVALGQDLLWPRDSRVEQALIAQAWRPAVFRKQAVMDRTDVDFVDPDEFSHLLSARSVLR
jgi:hypothetical protein